MLRFTHKFGKSLNKDGGVPSICAILGETPKGVDYHAKHGRLVRVKLGSRACGFSADSVRRLMNGEEA